MKRMEDRKKHKTFRFPLRIFHTINHVVRLYYIFPWESQTSSWIIPKITKRTPIHWHQLYDHRSGGCSWQDEKDRKNYKIKTKLFTTNHMNVLKVYVVEVSVYHLYEKLILHLEHALKVFNCVEFISIFEQKNHQIQILHRASCTLHFI